MEDGAVVEIGLDVLDEVGDGEGSGAVVEFNDDVAAVGLEFYLGHDGRWGDGGVRGSLWFGGGSAASG